MMKPVGKPDAGNLHVRFDERGGETERVLTRHRALPRLYSRMALNFQKPVLLPWLSVQGLHTLLQLI